MEFVLVLSATDRPVGTVGLRRLDTKKKNAELSIIIGDEECRGKGVAREACDLLIRYAYQVLGLRRINLELFIDNEPARRLYRRLGFRESSAYRERLKDGRLRRTISMSLDREDWDKKMLS